MRVSVIMPSRLDESTKRPGTLWLDSALASITAQSIFESTEFEVVVGLDAGAELPERYRGMVTPAVAHAKGQTAAINAALAKASGEVLVFLEDDDEWRPKRVEYALELLLDGYDLVSSNQTEVDCEGKFVRINDFPTPSGWLMRRSLVEQLGFFDEKYRWHMDNEYLGRISSQKKRRIHQVEENAPWRPWMRIVSQFSDIVRTRFAEPLVERTVNPNGGVSRIRTDQTAKLQSKREQLMLIERYGAMPW